MKQHHPDNLDEIIHGRSRLAVMAFLARVRTTDFVKLRDELNLSDGSLSQALKKLEEAHIVKLDRVIDINRTRTQVTLTRRGDDMFRQYVSKLSEMIGDVAAREERLAR